MLLKWCGSFMLLILTLYLCYEASAMERRRVRQTEGFLLLLRHIKSQISCFCTPVRDIFFSFENDSLERTGFLSEAKKGDFVSALNSCRDKIYLDGEEINLLLAFGEELGKSYRDEEIKNCDYYIRELENLYSKRREEQPNKSRLYRSLVLTCGLMVIIVFL